MAKKEDQQQEINILYKQLDHAWQRYIEGDVDSATQVFNDSKNQFLAQNISSRKTQNSRLTQKQILDRILSYDHPLFQGIDNNLRPLLSLAIVRPLHRDYLITSDPFQEIYMEHYRCVDLLAVIIGTEYIFQIDVEKIARETYGNLYKIPTGSIGDPTLPITYDDRHTLFPELSQLPELSFLARKALIGAIIYLSDQSGFVENGKIFDFDKSFACAKGLDELSDAELLDQNPGRVDLLMLFTQQELKQYASNEGLEAHGTKYQIANLIVENLDFELINKLLLSKTEGIQFFRPIIKNLPLLKKYIWAEINRISLYLVWFERFYIKKMDPRIYSEKEINQLHNIEYENRRRSNMSPFPPDSGLVSEKQYISYINDPRFEMERSYVSGIWDRTCDEIVESLAEKYAWYVHSHNTWLVSDAIAEYLPPETLAEFQIKCGKLYKYYWRDVLANYGSIRLYQMGKTMRSPRLLLCPGCGEEFLECSVSGYIAKLVNYKIRFCQSCYRTVCGHSACAKSLELTDEEMLELLRDLCSKMGSIPTIRFMKAPTFDKFDEAEQIEIIKHMLKMPPIKQYEIRFGSWMQSLIMSGVLEGDSLDIGRGYQCVAKDGHVCNSLAEKVIDDWLHYHNMGHEKEPLYPYDFLLNPSGKLRGDWKVKNIIIEYAGLDHPEYQAKIKAKQELAKKYQLNLIIVEPKDLVGLNDKLGYLANSHYQLRLFD